MLLDFSDRTRTGISKLISRCAPDKAALYTFMYLMSQSQAGPEQNCNNLGAIDTVGVLTSTGDFQNFGLLDQVKPVYPRGQQANLIILSHQARQEQLGAKKKWKNKPRKD